MPRAHGIPDTPDHRVALHASAHHGLITRADAMGLDMTPQMIATRIHQGWLERVQAGVYRVAGAPVTHTQHVAAAVYAAGSLALASHRTAGRLLGLGTPRIDVAEILVPDGHLPSPRGAKVRRTKTLVPIDRTVVDAIPTTSAVRTIVDLASVLSIEELEHAIEDCLRMELFALARLTWRVNRLNPGTRGLGRLRKLLDGRRAARLAGSRPERRLFHVIVGCGLPRPVEQYQIKDGGRFITRVDCAYPDVKVAVHYDTVDWHTRRTEIERDNNQDVDLATLGWERLRFNKSDLRNPSRVCRAVRAVLLLRGVQLSA